MTVAASETHVPGDVRRLDRSYLAAVFGAMCSDDDTACAVQPVDDRGQISPGPDVAKSHAR